MCTCGGACVATRGTVIGYYVSERRCDIVCTDEHGLEKAYVF